MISEEELELGDARYILHKIHLIVRDAVAKNTEQLEKQIDWLCRTIPYERAYTMIYDHDYVVPCSHMIDYKGKQRCPMWKDPNYGTYSFAEKYPEQTFEQWLEYIEGCDSCTECACEDVNVCWREAARRAVECK